MTRMKIAFQNNTNSAIKFISCRGTDWVEDDGHHYDIIMGSSGGKGTVIESISCPGNWESAHWGWLYFRIGHKYFSFYINVENEDCPQVDYLMWLPDMKNDNEQPGNPEHTYVKAGICTFMPKSQDEENGPLVTLVFSG